ncbi:hypothetical protein [Hugenholtzia roseola]|uniref:hypothetical protein n=1 Tax=Hugenholtzia roseola TaxID=1002 RepID=UPI000410257E|nr:hypothetical protein [Hugenholtzia roseola]
MKKIISYGALMGLIFFLSAYSCTSYAQWNTKPFEPKADMVAIKPTDKEVKLKVGQKLYFSMIAHGSVGLGAEANSQDSTVLNRIEIHTAHHNPDEEGMTGNDKATITFVFEALKNGKTTLITQENFRGEVRNVRKIRVIVK